MERRFAGRKMRQPAQASVPTAMTVNIGVSGFSAVSLVIHAPVIPARTSASGRTQQVDAMSEDATARPTRPSVLRDEASDEFTGGDSWSGALGMIAVRGRACPGVQAGARRRRA